MRKLIIFLVLITGFCIRLLAQSEWIVPQERKGRLSPFEFSDESRTKGLNHYNLNCALCHGQPGAGNYQNLVPPPGDPASADFQMNLDGEIFYKVMEGRDQMPSFKSVLTQDEIWEIISYIRSYNPDYVHAFMPTAEKSAYGGIVSITLTHLKDAGKIEAKVTGAKNGVIENIAGAEVVLRVKRTFGSLMVSEPQETNQNGIAVFNEPSDLPGNKEGLLELTAQLTNQDAYGITRADTALAVGKPFEAVSLTAERAMWNTVRKAPIWLLITFSMAVVLAWGTIFYILHQLKKITDIGKNEVKE